MDSDLRITLDIFLQALEISQACKKIPKAFKTRGSKFPDKWRNVVCASADNGLETVMMVE